MTSQPVEAPELAAAPRLWTIRDVSVFLGIPVATIYQWRVRSEGPPAMRLGRHLRYEPQDVAAWAHQQRDRDGRGRP
jgi:predicted DNA-binding transcriptional regulator AlpA